MATLPKVLPHARPISSESSTFLHVQTNATSSDGHHRDNCVSRMYPCRAYTPDILFNRSFSSGAFTDGAAWVGIDKPVHVGKTNKKSVTDQCQSGSGGGGNYEQKIRTRIPWVKTVSMDHLKSSFRRMLWTTADVELTEEADILSSAFWRAVRW